MTDLQAAIVRVRAILDRAADNIRKYAVDPDSSWDEGGSVFPYRAIETVLAAAEGAAALAQANGSLGQALNEERLRNRNLSEQLQGALDQVRRLDEQAAANAEDAKRYQAIRGRCAIYEALCSDPQAGERVDAVADKLIVEAAAFRQQADPTPQPMSPIIATVEMVDDETADDEVLVLMNGAYGGVDGLEFVCVHKDKEFCGACYEFPRDDTETFWFKCFFPDGVDEAFQPGDTVTLRENVREQADPDSAGKSLEADENAARGG